jgi:hypothetical protein
MGGTFSEKSHLWAAHFLQSPIYDDLVTILL